MAFFRQLRVLLWKNAKLRLRSPIKTMLEILLPLALFVILAIVRLRGLKEDKHECHFRARPLPSAGVLPFIQGFLCNWNNTCYQQTQQSERPGQVTSFNQSLLTKALVDIEKLLLDRKFAKDVETVMKDLGTLQKFMASVQNPATANRLNGHTVTGIPISSIMNNVTQVRQTLSNQNIKFTNQTWSLITNSRVDIAKILPNVTNMNAASVQRLLPLLFANLANLTTMNLASLPQLLPSYLSNLANVASLLPNLNATSVKDLACNESSQLYNFITVGSANGSDSLRDALCNRSAEDLLKIYQAFRGNVNPTQLQTEVRAIIRNVTSNDIGTGQDLINRVSSLGRSLTAMTSLMELFQHLQSLSQGLGGLAGSIVPGSSLSSLRMNNNTLKQIVGFTNLFCGSSESNDIARIIGNTQNLNLGSMRSSFRRKKRSLGNDLRQVSFCSMLNSMLNRGPVKYVWRQMKTILFGKILYTPDNPTTRKIIKEANATFNDMAILHKAAERWLDVYSPAIHRFLYFDPRVKTLRSIVDMCASGRIPALPRNIVQQCQFYKSFLSIDLKDPLKKTPYDWRDALKNLDNLLLQAKYLLGCFDYDKFYPVQNETVLKQLGHKGMQLGWYWAGIVFDNITDNGKLPSLVKVRIRMNADKVDSTRNFRVFDRYWRPYSRSRPWPDLKYFAYGFIYIQDMLERAVVSLQIGKPLQEGTYMQQFPYPCYVYDKFTRAISNSIPMFMVLAWIFAVSMTVRSIVYEKELRLKEFMRVMGLSNGVHWTAWFITTFVILFISLIMLLFILKIGGILEFTSASVMFVFLTSFLVSTIAQSFLISVFFSKANLAAACAGLIYFTFYLPYNVVTIREEEMTESGLTGLSLFCQVAFGIACQYIARFEEQGIGAQWHNMWENPSYGVTYSIGKVILMMWFDTFLYGLFAWYIEAVFPGEYGVPQPWYFPILKRYWCPDSECKEEEDPSSQTSYEMPHRDSPDLEAEPTNLRLGVAIRNLRKAYNSKASPAVDGLNLNFYEDQITSFLGHNGAGKTTTISILTGLYPPTSGTATVYGNDIRTEMSSIRKRMGLCPQYNVLFDDLSVEEHIRFYGLLKGVPSDAIEKEIERYVHEVGLPHKRHDLASKLSGGMKRKLSVAMAFVGDSKVIILDEPTAGVDPYARRSIWDILLKCRSRRTIILTTHHMDEADVLGDRIAIISKGKLKCCGSRFFLKNRFGKGYHLTIEKNLPERDDNEKKEENGETEDYARFAPAPIANVSKVSALIQDHVPDATLHEEVSTELSYLLPYPSVEQGQLEALLRDLEQQELDLGIGSFGISDSTLEEVFLSVADDPSDSVSPLDAGAYPLPVSRSSFRRKKPFRMLRSNSIASSHQELIENEQEQDAASVAGSVAGSTINVNSGDVETNANAADCPTTGKQRVTGSELISRQFFALLVKRFHNVRRSKKGFVAEIILPPVFILIAVILSSLWPGFTPYPAMELQPWLMQPRRGNPSMSIFYANDRPQDPVTQAYERMMRTGVGSGGTRCMNPAVYSLPKLGCSRELRGNRWSPVPKSGLNPKGPPCSCSSGYPDCRANGARPSTRLMESSDVLFNLTGYNLTDYLLRTSSIFRKRRYGGFSFGELNQDAKVRSQLPNGPQNISSIARVLERIVQASSNRSSAWIREDQQFWRQLQRFLGQGAEVRNNAKVWFLNKGYAASVSYLNVLNNLHLRVNLPPGKNPADYGISTWSHPMDFTQSQLNREARTLAIIDTLTAIVVIFALAFIPASFVLFLIDERISNAKHLQFVSGVNRNIYWIANFCWDFINYIVPLILCIIIFVAFQKKAFVSAENIGPFILLLVIYGYAVIPMMYPASYVFTTPSTAFVMLSCANLIIGMVTTLSTFVIELLEDDEPDLKEINAILLKVFLIFPQYCLGRGLIDLSANQLTKDVTIQLIGESFPTKKPLDWDLLGKNIFCLAIEGTFFFILTLLIENRFFYYKCYKPKAPLLKEPDNEDDDVVHERDRVLATSPAEDAMSVRKLVKSYRSMRGRGPAVNQITFGLKRAECFGLLGVNGAGKTTTFKMLTGDETVTSGDAFVVGHSILTEMAAVHLQIGYCPQFDAFNANLTGRETLTFFARLRGVAEQDVDALVRWVLHRMSLVPHADKTTQSYSGGNKRKLSTAIALIGDPPIMFLDEPTSGMDPGARRFLWNSVIRAVNEGRSVVLTSHSMEECEALCHRLAIMVNGQFRCLGSNQHLKSKFGEGYTVTLRLGAGSCPNRDKVADYIDEKFCGAVLKETHFNVLRFQIPPGVRLSTIFAELNTAKGDLGVEDYSVSQTTLDEVFINFAKDQSDMLADEQDARRAQWASESALTCELPEMRYEPSVHGSAVVLMSRSSSESSLPFSWSRAGSQSELIFTDQSGAATGGLKTHEARMNMSDIDV